MADFKWISEEERVSKELEALSLLELRRQMEVGFPILKEVMKKLVKGEELSLQQLEQLKGLYDVW